MFSARALLAVALGGLIFASCNLFEPAEPIAAARKRGAPALIIEGKKKLDKEQYEKALALFEEAITEDNKENGDTTLTEALFYWGKCKLRIAGVDLNDIWDQINPGRENSEDIPFLFRTDASVDLTADTVTMTDPIVLASGDTLARVSVIDSVFWERKILYDAISQAIKGLEKINRDWHSMDQVIQREQYESDYLMEISVRAILGIIDLNHNDRLDWDESMEERKTFRILTQDMQSLDDMELDSLRNLNKTPLDINPTIDLIYHSILQADTSYTNFNNELKRDDNLDTGMIADVGQMIGNFKNILPYFYYDDYTDNDSDYYEVNGMAGQQRMVWIDWDGDKKIDLFAPGALQGHFHIGDSAHMRDSSQYYSLTGFENDTGLDYQRFHWTGGWTYEFIGGDWGVDEEIMDGKDNDGDGLTDEDTRIVADTADDDGDYYDSDPADRTPVRSPAIPLKLYPMQWESDTDAVIDIAGTSWDTVQTSLSFLSRHAAATITIPDSLPRYTGPIPDAAGEFTGGDYGLDEEWYDGFDNDRDGLIDEDVMEGIPPESLRKYLVELLQ
ncbi:MAG: hypothetical protein GF398_07595 [Chitinivibrionales bacterium]|nr:hypothetical protein [Chitinivibrionales bacterium]